MIIGVPRETKRDEYRVGMLPVGVEEFTRAGHQVVVEAGAGLGSGLADHWPTTTISATVPNWCLRPRKFMTVREWS